MKTFCKLPEYPIHISLELEMPLWSFNDGEYRQLILRLGELRRIWRELSSPLDTALVSEEYLDTFTDKLSHRSNATQAI